MYNWEQSAAVIASSSARVLSRGMARLVEELRDFVEAFGLAAEPVFQDLFEPFKDRRTEDVLREWLRGGQEGSCRLQALIDDLLDHQVALVSALDGIAAETVAQIGNCGRRRGPLAWSSRERRRKELAEYPRLRHALVVVPGLAQEYLRIRTASRDHRVARDRAFCAPQMASSQ